MAVTTVIIAALLCHYSHGYIIIEVTPHHQTNEIRSYWCNQTIRYTNSRYQIKIPDKLSEQTDNCYCAIYHPYNTTLLESLILVIETKSIESGWAVYKNVSYLNWYRDKYRVPVFSIQNKGTDRNQFYTYYDDGDMQNVDVPVKVSFDANGGFMDPINMICSPDGYMIASMTTLTSTKVTTLSTTLETTTSTSPPLEQQKTSDSDNHILVISIVAGVLGGIIILMLLIVLILVLYQHIKRRRRIKEMKKRFYVNSNFFSVLNHVDRAPSNGSGEYDNAGYNREEYISPYAYTKSQDISGEPKNNAASHSHVHYADIEVIPSNRNNDKNTGQNVTYADINSLNIDDKPEYAKPIKKVKHDEQNIQ